MNIDDRCLDCLPPEPIAVYQDADGTIHFATDLFPLRTMIDVYNLAYTGNWMIVDEVAGVIRLEADGRVAVYKRVATDIHGVWICNLVRKQGG